MPQLKDDNELQVREISFRQEEGYSRKTIVYTTVAGVRRAASLIMPEGLAIFPIILYVHWYEPGEPETSNRHEFDNEAIEMAKRGAGSMLIETMWSDLDFFIKRTQADDQSNSIQQVDELRQAMDILLGEFGADPKRFAYVGHDFGAMYGILMGSGDSRPTHYVLMAGTPRFHEWYLYYPPMEDDARDRFIMQMKELDPIARVASLAPAPVYFQFGDNDPHVPLSRTEEFFAAAEEPKKMDIYEAGHGLNEQARSDRMAWLTEQLGLKV